MSKNGLTNKQKMNILSDMHIIVDTREQKWNHIKEYLDKNKIPYTQRKLDSGDYSFVLPNYPELDMDEKILIERKANLSEVAGNFTQGRARFERMFERIEDDQKIHLLMETSTWRKIFNGTYRSGFHPNAFKASLLSYSIRYECPVWFAENKESPEILYKLMYYELNEYLNTLEITLDK